MVDREARRGFRESMRLLFEDLSFAQVAAGALAAVTSMLFASQIGIAGSVIGAAVGSVVATVSSQVYKKFINASAEKIKVIPASVGMASAVPDAGARPAPEAGASGADSDTKAEAVSDEGADAAPGSYSDDSDASAYSNPELYRARAAERMRRQRRRRVIVVAALSSVLAVLASALLVYVLTAGEGLGTKPEAVWSPPQSERASAHEEGPRARGDDASSVADDALVPITPSAGSSGAPETSAAPSAPAPSSSDAASSSSASSSASSSSSSSSSAASSSSASSSGAVDDRD